MSGILTQTQQQVVGDALIEALRAKLPEVIDGYDARLRLRRVERLDLQGDPYAQYEVAVGDERKAYAYRANTPTEAIVAFLQDQLGLYYEGSGQPDRLVLDGRNGPIELVFKNLPEEAADFALIPLEELMEPGAVFRPKVYDIAGLKRLKPCGCAYSSLSLLQKRAMTELPGKIAVAVCTRWGELFYLNSSNETPVFFNADFWKGDADGATFRFPTPVAQGGAPCIIYPVNSEFSFITARSIDGWADAEDTPILNWP